MRRIVLEESSRRAYKHDDFRCGEDTYFLSVALNRFGVGVIADRAVRCKHYMDNGAAWIVTGEGAEPVAVEYCDDETKNELSMWIVNRSPKRVLIHVQQVDKVVIAHGHVTEIVWEGGIWIDAHSQAPLAPDLMGRFAEGDCELRDSPVDGLAKSRALVRTVTKNIGSNQASVRLAKRPAPAQTESIERQADYGIHHQARRDV